MRTKTIMICFMVVLFIGLTGLNPKTVQASTNGHTQDQAVTWIREQEGSTYERSNGYQCVDLIRAYYEYLGQAAPYGNANCYLNDDDQYTPSGWTKHYGTDGIQPGDITVWTGGDYGHVALVVETNEYSCTVMQQNGDGNGRNKTEASKGHYGTQYYSGITGYIHPDFSPADSIQLWGIEENSSWNGSAKFWAKRSDTDSNHFAVFYLDDVPLTGHISADSSGFFSITVDTTKYANGSHKLSINYVNTASGHWDVRNINFNNSDNIQLWGIEENSSWEGSAKFWAKRSDNDSNHFAVFYLDDVPLTGHISADSSGFFSITVDTTKYANGSHKLSINYVNTASGYWDERQVIFQNPVQQTFHVSYDANGGTGTPSEQVKISNSDLTLSSIKPTRDGYIFASWNTKADGTGKHYQPGDVYAEDEDLTLYVQWISEENILTLPNALAAIEGEVFRDTSAVAVRIPDTVTSIADDAFDENIIVIASEDSYADSWAEWNGIEVIVEY